MTGLSGKRAREATISPDKSPGHGNAGHIGVCKGATTSGSHIDKLVGITFEQKCLERARLHHSHITMWPPRGSNNVRLRAHWVSCLFSIEAPSPEGSINK